MVKNVFKKLGKKQKNNKGFSLVELIVVIAIMAVLVGVLAPQLIKYVEKSREATDIQNCDSIASALKSYYSDKETATDIKIEIEGTGITTGNTDAALVDAGLEKTKLKGKNWSKIKMEFNTGTGVVKYTVTNASGKTPYYTKNGDATQLIPATNAAAPAGGNQGNANQGQGN